jgi:hypothetical protein
LCVFVCATCVWLPGKMRGSAREGRCEREFLLNGSPSLVWRGAVRWDAAHGGNQTLSLLRVQLLLGGDAPCPLVAATSPSRAAQVSRAKSRSASTALDCRLARRSPNSTKKRSATCGLLWLLSQARHRPTLTGERRHLDFHRIIGTATRPVVPLSAHSCPPRAAPRRNLGCEVCHRASPKRAFIQ